MSQSRTADESKQDYVQLMGEPLGKIFHALWQEMAWLYTKWGEYVALYGTKPGRIDLMNKSAPRFFRIVHDSLWEETLMHIARLTDPAETGKTEKKENLSIQRLLLMVPDETLKQSLEEKIETAKGKSEFCRDWRNRRIAHIDLQLAIEDGINPLQPASRVAVKEALSAIADVLNTVTLHYNDSTTRFDVPNGYGGGESLLHVIDDGLKMDEERAMRIQSGDFRESDFEPRDI
jgi:hypothetical protein